MAARPSPARAAGGDGAAAWTNGGEASYPGQLYLFTLCLLFAYFP